MRKESDFYVTPSKVISDFISECNYYFKDVKSILEPCAGNGAFIKSIIDSGIYKQSFLKKGEPSITAVELRDEQFSELLPIVDTLTIGNYLSWDSKKKYDLIITNPPYSLAEEFIRHSFDLVNPDTGKIIMLLRINFLGAQRRFDFWKKYPLTNLHPLSCRPSFTKSGTDQTEYAWFVWDMSDKRVAEERDIINVWGRDN